ncbi:hypothetical protein BJ912DRAFT_924484 [Pholiota molesta]|nr:hypothetical protein BJ912DRAFT_924484 [Pholiota molesta]
MAKSPSKKQARQARPSPVKSKKKATETTLAPLKEKPARRCNKCEGRPLRTQCCHTKAGENYLREQEIMNNLNAEPGPAGLNDDHADGSTETTPLAPSLGRSVEPPTGRDHIATPNSTSIPDALIDPRLLAPSSSQTIPHGLNPSTPTSAPTDLLDQSLRSPHSSQTTHTGITHSLSPFRPLRLQSDDQQSYTESQFSSPFRPGATGTGSTTSSASASNRLGHNQHHKKQRRPNAEDTYHGFVNGVYRGTERYSLCRSHAKPSPIDNTSKASAMFLENIRALIQKCEDLSSQTSCWLFIGAQHPNATGETLHYASARLQRDAPEIADIASDFCSTITHAKEVRRRDIIEVTKNLERARQQKADLEARMQAIASEKKSQDETLRRYQEKYGMLDLDSVE